MIKSNDCQFSNVCYPINKIHLIKQNQNCFLFWGPNCSQRRPENEEWLLLFSSFFGLGNRNPTISSNWIGGNQELRGNENNCIAKLNLNLICKKSKSKVLIFVLSVGFLFVPFQFSTLKKLRWLIERGMDHYLKSAFDSQFFDLLFNVSVYFCAQMCQA